MFSRTFLRLKSTSVTKDISEDVAKTLSRIRVIENVKECANVTEKINAQESPIGVDAEAITGNFFQKHSLYGRMCMFLVFLRAVTHL